MLSQEPIGCKDHFFELESFERFMEDWNIQVRPANRRMWRTTFPNVGQLDGFPHFGNVYILATDGILAYYHVDFSGQLFLGHLKAFNGPIAKEFVYDEDWDFVRRCRKVNVFKRADGTIVVIPKDTFWDHYWSQHERQSSDEVEKKHFKRKAEKTKRQLLLESL